ncbi:MAG: hypothetical protein ACYTDW_17665 [Planctomycetota bacterium]
MSTQQQQKGKESNEYITKRTINCGYRGIKAHPPRFCVHVTERTAYRVKTV